LQLRNNVGSIIGAPIEGLGAIEIFNSSSSITCTSSNCTLAFNGALRVIGNNDLVITNFTAPNDFTIVPYLDTQNLVTVTGNALVVPGGLIANVSFIATEVGITFNGNVSVNGSVKVETNSSLTIGSSLTILGGNSFTVQERARIWLGGSLDLGGSSLLIPNTSSLHVERQGYIAGNVVNYGFLNITTTRTLVIKGNYEHHGILSVGIASGSVYPLQVQNGSINITEGQIHYSLNKLPLSTSSTYLVASADAVNGTFVGSAVPVSGSAVKRNLDIKVGQKDITIYYTFHPDDIHWYIWLGLAAGVVLVVILIIALIVKLGRRAKYQKIGGNYV